MSKIDYEKTQFETLLIHAGQGPDKETGALATPIYQTSTFCFDTVEEGAGKFDKSIPGYVYCRGGNPTTRALELKCAAIEGGEDCVAAASGMGAIGSVVAGLLKAGDHVVCGDTLYGGTAFTMRENLPQFGIGITFVDTTEIENVRAALTPATKMIYFETPTNPTLKVSDIRAIADLAHEHGIKLVIDSTFAPPPIQFPIKLGADIVVHSVTKYINGHGDVLGGVVIGSAADIALIRGRGVTKICGTPPSPLNSFLVLRGMKTLSLRMKQHSENALAIARFLESSPYVHSVNYPGLESHPQHALAKTQMNGQYSGILSFEMKEGINGLSAFEAGKKFVNNLKIPVIAVSLGDPDTLIEHPASMTHANVPKADREAVGIGDGLIRMSVGLEHITDLVDDLRQSFATL